MKTQLIKRFGYICCLLCLMLLFADQRTLGQTSLHTPYPIIFVHGLIGDNSSFGIDDGKFNDILDYLHGAGLTDGGNIDVCLSFARSPDSLYTKMDKDVHLFTVPRAADFYEINFNVHANGSPPVIHKDALDGVIVPVITSLNGISDSDTQFFISSTDEFQPGDIISIASEFMQVLTVDASQKVLTVKRGVCNSVAASHIFNLSIINISNESNQASIAKQGYGLKLAIAAILQANPGVKKVILVGHSMGGLAAREYIRSFHLGDVAKIVTIGTPHYGSNLTVAPQFATIWRGIDNRSDAARDLKTGSNGFFQFPYGGLGVYLFGGNENSVADGYLDKDVNSNGQIGDTITGINDFRTTPFPENIARTWIASRFALSSDIPIGVAGYPLIGDNDGIVLTRSHYVSSNDTLMTNRPHVSILGYLGEALDYYTLLRGLDEPDDPSQAYEIGQNSSIKGFITFNKGNNQLEEDPKDIDLFKINIQSHSTLTISMSGNSNTGIQSFSLLNADQSPRKSSSNINLPITDELDAGTYYIQIIGQATHGVKISNPPYKDASYNYPYTLTTTTTPIAAATLTASPDKSLNYYDVAAGQARDTTIQLTNNGTSALTVSNITLNGTNPDQFSITSPLTLSIPTGQTQNLKVRFSPTSIGSKTATLNITNSSSDVPNKTISLQGNGTDHATKTFAVLPDGSYNFGNKTITTSTAEAFTLKNTGSSNLTISTLSISGLNAGDFFLSVPATPPYNIGANGDSSIIVANFKPRTTGSKTAKLIIANNADNKSPGDTITLYGNGTNSIYTGIANNIIRYEYWFDNNYLAKVATSISPQNLSYINTNVSTTGLTIGEHTLHIRYQDQQGEWSAISAQEFYKQPITLDSVRRIIAYEYWFDNNFSSRIDSAVVPQQTFSLNAFNIKSLNVGQHTYHVRFMDDLGQWGAVTSGNFYRSRNENGPNTITAYSYWFDSNDKQKNIIAVTSPSTTVALSTNINTSSLVSGMHIVHFQFKDNYGLLSAATSDTITVLKDTLPIITSFSPVSGSSGAIVTITGHNFTGADTVSFGGTLASSFTVSSDSVIFATIGSGASGNVTVITSKGKAGLGGFNFMFSLPSSNFTISTTSATCNGVADGTINITATQSLNYTATITGGSVTQFMTSDTIKSLAAGTYHLCITVQGQTNYQQCYDLVIGQPKDLSVYSTVNDIDNTVTLQLNNGTNYFIQLNGINYSTTDNSITLPVKDGDNQLSITTDKLCQGTYQTVISLLKKIIPFPDPFDNTLSVNLGNEPVANALFEVHNTASGKILYTKQMANQSGVVQLDLSSLREGVYALYIKLDDIQRIYKIIKK